MKRSKAHKQAIRKICEHYEKPEVQAFYAEASKCSYGVKWPDGGVSIHHFEDSLRFALMSKNWFDPPPDPIDWSFIIDLTQTP